MGALEDKNTERNTDDGGLAYEFQREVQELLKHSAQAICNVFHFRICGRKTFALLGHECWLTRAEQTTMIKKRPASLK